MISQYLEMAFHASMTFAAIIFSIYYGIDLVDEIIRRIFAKKILEKQRQKSNDTAHHSPYE